MTIDSTGLPALKVRLKGRSRESMKTVAGILVETADAARTWIQTHYGELFPGTLEPKEDDEDEPDSEGTLGGSLWRSDMPRPSADMFVELGWGVIHGRVLEFGPKERGPKKIEVKRAKALRIGTAGGVIYRKSSTYIWRPSMLRPHMMKAMDAVTPAMLSQIADAL